MKSLRRTLLRPAIAGALIGSTIGAAWAPAGALEVMKYNGGGVCVLVSASISTGGIGGTNAAGTRTKAPSTYSCTDSRTPSYAPGDSNIRVGFYNLVNGSICTGGFWYKNAGNTSTSKNVAFQGARACGTLQCYTTQAWGSYWNGDWLGAGDPPGGNPVVPPCVYL